MYANKVSLPLRCVHLTCKSMMIFGEDFAQDPEYQAGMVEMKCLRTATNLGPDNGEVGLGCCSQSGRTCYQEY